MTLRGISLRDEHGQAAAEMALVLPILAGLMLAIAQFGIVFNQYLTLTDATRAGARKAAVARFAKDDGAAAAALVKSAAGDLDTSKLTVSVTSTNWNVPGSDVTVTAQYPYSINILGWVVKSGSLSTTQTERLE